MNCFSVRNIRVNTGTSACVSKLKPYLNKRDIACIKS